MTTGDPATLHGLAGTGYAVVESLPALGKGRSCHGVFTTEEAGRTTLEDLLREGAAARYEGVVHVRHTTERRELTVRVTGFLDAPSGKVSVEFTAPEDRRLPS